MGLYVLCQLKTKSEQKWINHSIFFSHISYVYLKSRIILNTFWHDYQLFFLIVAQSWSLYHKKKKIIYCIYKSYNHESLQKHHNKYQMEKLYWHYSSEERVSEMLPQP